MIHLDDAGVERYGDLAAITDGLIEAWKQLAAGNAATSVRVRTTSIDKLMASGMAAVLPSQGVAGGKLYATHKNGFDFLIALFGAEGGVLATIEGRVLTAMRTAAATGVAVRYLKPEGATVAALFGTGYQSTWHALVLQQELELAELRICGRTPSAVDRLVAWSKDRGIPAVAAGPDEAIRDAAGRRRRHCGLRARVLRFRAGRQRAGLRRGLHEGRTSRARRRDGAPSRSHLHRQRGGSEDRSR